MGHDPSVTAEVLKRSNAAFFGNETPATDLFEATFRLGFYEVYRIVALLYGHRLLRLPSAAEGLDIESVWHHSALTAVAASTVAKE